MTRRFADERSAALQACRISIPKESSVGYRLFQDEIPVTTLLGLPTQTWTPPSTALTVSRSDRMAAIPLMGMVDMPQEYVTSLAPRTLCCTAGALNQPRPPEAQLRSGTPRISVHGVKSRARLGKSRHNLPLQLLHGDRLCGVLQRGNDSIAKRRHERRGLHTRLLGRLQQGDEFRPHRPEILIPVEIATSHVLILCSFATDLQHTHVKWRSPKLWVPSDGVDAAATGQHDGIIVQQGACFE